MSVETTQFTHPIPAHLAGVRHLGLSLAHWADRAAEKRLVRRRAEQERVRSEWEMRTELARLERERESAWITWHLHHLR